MSWVSNKLIPPLVLQPSGQYPGPWLALRSVPAEAGFRGPPENRGVTGKQKVVLGSKEHQLVWQGKPFGFSSPPPPPGRPRDPGLSWPQGKQEGQEGTLPLLWGTKEGPHYRGAHRPGLGGKQCMFTHVPAT